MVVAGSLALAALAATVASLVYLHLAPTGLSPVRNAVSQYGITPCRAGYRAATLSFGSAAAALAVGLSIAFRHDDVGLEVVLLGVFAVARGLISWFPMDAPGSARTVTGRRHGLLAILAFAAVTIDAFGLRAVLERAGCRRVGEASGYLGWAMLVLVFGMLISRSHPALRERFGLIERGFYLAAIGWFAMVAVGCVAIFR